MKDIQMLTYCGLHCGLCAQRARIPKQAQVLRESLAKEGIEYWGPSIQGYEGFREFLAVLCDPDRACPACRQGGGPPECEVRECAKSRGVDACPFCQDFPCERVEGVGKTYPTLIADGLRLRTIGADAWNREQEARAFGGFCYADIRCPRG